MRRSSFLLMILMFAATAIAGDLLHRRTRTIPVCTVPPYDYGHRRTSLPVFALSETALPLEAFLGPPPAVTAIIRDQSRWAGPASPLMRNPDAVPGVASTPPVPPRVPLRAKAFQFGTTALAIDHCRVSDIVLTIREDGLWYANFVAEQDPQLVPEQVRPIAERFVRNGFHITFQPAALTPLAPDPNVPAIGAPQPAPILLPPFWVEKRDLATKHLSGQSRWVQENFEAIQRVKIEFRYE